MFFCTLVWPSCQRCLAWMQNQACLQITHLTHHQNVIVRVRERCWHFFRILDLVWADEARTFPLVWCYLVFGSLGVPAFVISPVRMTIFQRYLHSKFGTLKQSLMDRSMLSRSTWVLGCSLLSLRNSCCLRLGYILCLSHQSIHYRQNKPY